MPHSWMGGSVWGMSEHVPPSGEGAAQSPPERVAPPTPPVKARRGWPVWPVLGGFLGGLLVGVAVAVPMFSLLGGGAHLGPGMGRGMGGFGPGLPFMHFYSPFAPLVFVGLIALAVWLAVSSRTQQPQRAGAAFEILRQRYAKGEISADEYARMSEVLRRS
jgi:putative membrane protein